MTDELEAARKTDEPAPVAIPVEAIRALIRLLPYPYRAEANEVERWLDRYYPQEDKNE